MKSLEDIAKAINAFDKARAATSYGDHYSHLGSVQYLLPKEDRQVLAKLAQELAVKRLNEAVENLKQLGIEVSGKEYPDTYRLFMENHNGYKGHGYPSNE